MSWKWYGVKTAFRTIASGKAKSRDANFVDDATLVDERITLVRARTFDEALAKGEAEAKKYSAGNYQNRYGQTVQTHYLRAIDAFELFEDPAAGTEVYSRTEIISGGVSDNDLADRYFGPLKTHSASTQRSKFFNSELRELEGR